MKKLFILLMMGWLPFGVFAQTTVLSLIGSSGGEDSTFSWSLGEVATQSMPVDTLGQHLTIGFQQGHVIMVGIEDHEQPMLDAVLYPNPTDGKMWLEIKNKVQADYKAKVCDITGKTVMETSRFANKQELDLTNLAPGNYNITILSTENKQLKTFKIIKN